MGEGSTGNNGGVSTLTNVDVCTLPHQELAFGGRSADDSDLSEHRGIAALELELDSGLALQVGVFHVRSLKFSISQRE